MKKVLDLLIAYFITLIIGILAGSFLYSFYLNILNYIAGQPVVFFANENLIQSLFYISYCILLFICPIISYYRIRRPGGLSQTFAYIFIVLLTWGILFPGIIHIEKQLGNRYVDDTEIHLSKGYFRKIDNKIYYFTRDFESVNNNLATTNAVIIDTSENGTVDYKLVRDISSMDFNKKASPFKDILAKQNFDNSRITLKVDLRNLFSKLSKVLDLRLYYILYFLSFVLVICSIYSLSSFFNWKLLNAVLVLFMTISMIAANSVDKSNLFCYVKAFFEGTRPFEFLSQYIYESFLFVFNTFCSLFFITIGIVKFALHNHSKKN